MARAKKNGAEQAGAADGIPETAGAEAGRIVVHVNMRSIPITSVMKIACGANLPYSDVMPSVTQAVAEIGGIEFDLTFEAGRTPAPSDATIQGVIAETVRFVAKPLDEVTAERAASMIEEVKAALERRRAEAERERLTAVTAEDL